MCVEYGKTVRTKKSTSPSEIQAQTTRKIGRCLNRAHLFFKTPCRYYKPSRLLNLENGCIEAGLKGDGEATVAKTGKFDSSLEVRLCRAFKWFSSQGKFIQLLLHVKECLARSNLLCLDCFDPPGLPVDWFTGEEPCLLCQALQCFFRIF